MRFLVSQTIEHGLCLRARLIFEEPGNGHRRIDDETRHRRPCSISSRTSASSLEPGSSASQPSNRLPGIGPHVFGRHDPRHDLAVTSDCDDLAVLCLIEQARKMRLRFVGADRPHIFRLVVD